MNHFLKIILAGLLMSVALTGCKKAQEQSAEAARETIMEMKADTVDAAHEAAVKAEEAANAIAKASDESATTMPESGTNAQ